MSNSNLVNTALGTGGTSFDTATCIGGKCEYPLYASNNYAKVYSHNMVCTQDKYSDSVPDLDTNLVDYDATTAPYGSKPIRSPFDDDASAYFVGDISVNPVGNGLVSFQRLYATIPSEHIEPYGLFSRTLPAYSTDAITLSPDDANSLVLKEQYSTDGVNWTTRATGSMGNNVAIGSTVDGETGVTVNNSTLDWKDYAYVRLRYEVNLETNLDMVNNVELQIIGDFASWRIDHPTSFSFSWGTQETNIAVLPRIRCKVLYGNAFRNWDAELNRLYIESVTPNATSGHTELAVVANTQAFNLGAYQDESYLKDFGGIEFGRRKRLQVYGTYSVHQVQQPYNVDSVGVPAFTRFSNEEVNCSARIKYTYQKTNQPESILLNAKETFPNTLTTATTPNTQQYLQYVKDGVYFNAENQFIERYMGNIYRLGQIQSTLQ